MNFKFKKTIISILILCNISIINALPNRSDIPGRLSLPPTTSARARDFKITLSVNGGDQEIYGYCAKDGSFTLKGIPPGIHILDVTAIGWIFPEVILEVANKPGGIIRAYFAENKKEMTIPLVIPGATINHFEERKPFSIWNFVKSPTGIMVCMLLFGLIVLPMLKVDPEEYQKMKDMMAQSGAPNMIGNEGTSGSQRGPPQLQNTKKRN